MHGHLLTEVCSGCGVAEVEVIGRADMEVCLPPSHGIKQCSAKHVCYSVMHLWCQLSFEQAGNGSVKEHSE